MSAPKLAPELTTSEVSRQESALSRFACLLNASLGSPGSFSESRVKDAVPSLSKAVTGHDVVLTLPSLDMHSTPVRDVSLPDLGEHRKTHGLPEMKASVLDKTLKNSTTSKDAEEGEEQAAHHLSVLTSWTKSSLIYAPDSTMKNVCASFQSLIDKRIRAWTLLMLKHSLKSGDQDSRHRLLGMLSCSMSTISSKIKFSTLPLPDSARGQPKEADVILPLLFQVETESGFQGRVETSKFQAPGTISGFFSKDTSTPGITKVEIRFDCAALLDAMVEQARLVVFKAVAGATASVKKPAPKTSLALPPIAEEPKSRVKTAISGTFATSLNLSEEATAKSPRLQKAHNSALRLSGILHGRNDALPAGPPVSLPRKHRSVTFDVLRTPSASASSTNIHAAKRQRTVPSTKGRLRSMKSFGRPHAETGPGARNATFNDFGRAPLAAGPIWGRDGKLKNHPMPGGLAQSKGHVEVSERQNATFDFGTPSRSATGLSNATPKQPDGSPGLPRTATALENWLVQATKGGSSNMMMEE